MQHRDARAIRERLNSIVVALVTLEENPHIPQRMQIARTAFEALQEISTLITVDEEEENGDSLHFNLWQLREKIRQQEPQAEFHTPITTTKSRAG